MKIYFAGSIRGGRDDAELYGRIIRQLTSYGDVLTEHVGDPTLTKFGQDLSHQEIHDTDVAWLREANALVAETTINSLGVGYELGLAAELMKPILCIYRPEVNQHISPMLAGNSQIEVKEYRSTDELPELFTQFFERLKVSA